CPGKPSADTGGLRPLEQVAFPIVQQFPRQTEQQCGNFFGRVYFRFRHAVFKRGVDLDRKAATCVATDVCPVFYDVCSVDQRHRGVMQEPTPFDEVFFYFVSTVTKVMAGPDGILLQVPTQFPCLNRSDGRNEAPLLHAVDMRLTLCGWFIDKLS